jgi:uncharacterized protein (UPF0303 family)
MTDVPDLTRFGPEGAWLLGSRLVEACRACALPVAIDIRLGSQQVFHAALPGSSADNDRWARREGRIAWHFGLPSLEVWRRYVGDDGDPMAFLAAFALPAEEYFLAGGAVPITVGGAMVGVLAVSGLESSEDHALAVAAVRELANDAEQSNESEPRNEGVGE